jgi:hypothetical protein
VSYIGESYLRGDSVVKDKVNRIRVQFIVEWPKDLLKVFSAPLKRLFSALIKQIVLWIKTWPRL